MLRMLLVAFCAAVAAPAAARPAPESAQVEAAVKAGDDSAGLIERRIGLKRAGARVYLNTGHAASHHKIVTVKGATVITGSYNFTQAAQSKHAENVVAISGNRSIAGRFVENFEFHRLQSVPWRRP
jgi:phosphatidylserine/phosphatidylglycerophosphate/cardiolipin synthase-like enzyme